MTTPRTTGSRTWHVMSGFEGIKYPPGTGNRCNLRQTGHYERFYEDLAHLRSLGTTFFRASIPWHVIEYERGQYDWTWTDAYLAACQALDLTPIVDLCHHSSAPECLVDSFANPDFPHRFTLFVHAFADRYPHIKWYTLINEPKATADLATHVWYPHHPNTLLMLKHMLQAICQATEMLRGKDSGVRFFHTDAVEHEQSRYQVVQPKYADGRNVADHAVRQDVEVFNGVRRFVHLDLLLGQLGPEHPHWDELLAGGFTEAELGWFQDHPAHIDVFGGDYYLHCERLKGDGNEPPARGPADILMDYYQRYGATFPRMQFAIGEVNVRGSVYSRISWLKYVAAQAEVLERRLGDRFWGFCWYPATDTYDWDSLVTLVQGHLDPTGIIPLNPHTNERIVTPLADLFGQLARGETTACDIPAYSFETDMHNYPVGRLGYQWQDWIWIPQAARVHEASRMLRAQRMSVATRKVVTLYDGQ